MRKKIAVIVVCFLVSFFSALAQKKSQEVMYADKYFNAEDYFLASEYYLKAYKKYGDIYAAYQFAECKRQFFDYTEAEKYYEIVREKELERFPLALYYHALMLKDNGKYKDAKEGFEAFIASRNHDKVFADLAVLHYNGCVIALNELKKPHRNYRFSNLGAPVNSEESDFSPAIFDNDYSLVIASARKRKNHEQIYAKLGGTFLDMYRFEKSDSIWRSLDGKKDGFDKVNTKHHDGAGIFNSAKDKFYFTRCDLPGKEARDMECGIYVSKLENSVWKEPVLLNQNINMPTEYNAQPALTSSGDTLFFTSKRPGGFGGNDIWMSVKNGDENWQSPKNLGSKVNTIRHEMTPEFYPKERLLFFSSDGHESLGGFDIFMVNGDDFSNLRNIGLPFNSNRDDFYFVIGEEIGYLSSNREGGLGHDDVYIFDLVSDEAIIAIIEADTSNVLSLVIVGIIKDTDGNVEEGLLVLLEDSLGNEVKRVLTDSKGAFEFTEVDPTQSYQVVLKHQEAFLTDPEEFVVEQVEVRGVYKTTTDDAKLISISGVVRDEKGNPSIMQEVVLLNMDNEELQSTYTDDTGYFIFSNLSPEYQYQVMLRDPKTGKLVPIDSDKINKMGSERDLNTTSLDLAVSGVPSRVPFENIYFDFNKYELRKEAKVVLNNLVSYAKQYKHLKIEINGYTDAIGSAEYNKELSAKRGKVAYDYLVSEGLQKSQIVVNSYGSGSPVASNVTAIGRQLNRRVEFYVVGGGQFDASASIYILKPNTSLTDLARRFNMSVAELEEMNGGKLDVSQAYQPVRVRSYSGKGIENTKNNQVAVEQNPDVYNKGVYYAPYDGSGYYVVLPKNTLYSISKICGTTTDKLREWNNIKSNVVYTGQRLVVAEQVFDESYMSPTALSDAGVSIKDHAGEVVKIGNEWRYVVKEGDTFDAVSKRFDMTLEELRMKNDLDSYELKNGMVLRVKYK